MPSRGGSPSTPALSPPPSDGGSNGISTGTVVGIAIGGVVILAVLSLLFIFCKKKRRRNEDNYYVPPPPPQGVKGEIFFEFDINYLLNIFYLSNIFQERCVGYIQLDIRIRIYNVNSARVGLLTLPVLSPDKGGLQ